VAVAAVAQQAVVLMQALAVAVLVVIAQVLFLLPPLPVTQSRLALVVLAA
jgi:hypothetical protein